MRLITECKSCKKHNKVSSKGVLLRRDLEEKIGENYRFRCANCGIENTIHINKIEAQNNNLVKFILVPIGVLLVLVGFFIMGSIIVTAALLSSNTSNSTLFNKSKI